MAEGEQAFARPSHLPPRDAWKVNPDRLRKFYAPTDDRGFVLPDATVEKVRELFEDDYEWPIDSRYEETRPNVHHFHWTERQYSPQIYGGLLIPRRFRELPSVKGILPRQFHNVIHAVTLPPDVPLYLDMAQHVEAYTLARQTFQSATRTVAAHARFGVLEEALTESEDVIANEMLISAFDRQFRDYKADIERFVGAAGLESLRLNDPKFAKRKPHEVKRLLGRVVRMNETNYVPLFRMAA